MRQRRRISISPGEREVLIMIGRGTSNKAIADRLHMSISNVKQLIYTACVKLGVNNRAQECITAIYEGVVTPQDIFSPDEIAWFIRAIDIETLESIIAPLLKQKLEGRVPARQMTGWQSPRRRSVPAGPNGAFCSMCVLGRPSSPSPLARHAR
jgi:DNA-binding CsgD family transcriptional regulator